MQNWEIYREKSYWCLARGLEGVYESTLMNMLLLSRWVVPDSLTL